ncbi:MAG: hypothetical protein HFJ72_08975 [Adlercreutzia sp.]|nr:hypothetical protein [Adlercreutzia sp.]
MFKDKLTGVLGSAKDKAGSLAEKATASAPLAKAKEAVSSVAAQAASSETMQQAKDIAVNVGNEAVQATLHGGNPLQAAKSRLEAIKTEMKEEAISQMIGAVAQAVQESQSESDGQCDPAGLADGEDLAPAQ